MDELLDLRQATRATRCLDCGKCTALCPLAPDDRFSPRRIAALDLQDELEGRGAGIERCLTCGACELRCPQGVRFIDYVRGLREKLPEAERAPCPHFGVFQSIARSMSEDGGVRTDTSWIGDGLRIAREGEVALFVGCLPYFDAYFRNGLGVRPIEIARAAIRVLNASGIDPVLVDGERCCGHDLLWNGERKVFETLARANTATFRDRGIRRILTACAECCRTWRLDYPEVVPGYAPRVEHIAEFLSDRIQNGDLKIGAGASERYTYQDPCRLGRQLGVVEAPRTVLSSLGGGEVLEMRRSGRDAVCCGTSGFMHCDASSKRLQHERLREATATGADALVTACPKCFIHLSCAKAEEERAGKGTPSIRIEDLTVIASDRLGASSDARESHAAPEARGSGGAS